DAAGRLERVPATELIGTVAIADAPRIEHALRTAGHEPRVVYGTTAAAAEGAELRFTIADAGLADAEALLAQLGVAHAAHDGLLLERPATP
ncbi:MAG TPA: hypothetical protein VFM87_03100, partial [Agrococcus sp.]|nr:hypothetical protein [Agrococcus sp.]